LRLKETVVIVQAKNHYCVIASFAMLFSLA